MYFAQPSFCILEWCGCTTNFGGNFQLIGYVTSLIPNKASYATDVLGTPLLLLPLLLNMAT